MMFGGLFLMPVIGALIAAGKIRTYFCPCPMPDLSFLRHRCASPCQWCDHMDAWLKEEPKQSLGPYR